MKATSRTFYVNRQWKATTIYVVVGKVAKEGRIQFNSEISDILKNHDMSVSSSLRESNGVHIFNAWNRINNAIDDHITGLCSKSSCAVLFSRLELISCVFLLYLIRFRTLARQIVVPRISATLNTSQNISHFVTLSAELLFYPVCQLFSGLQRSDRTH